MKLFKRKPAHIPEIDESFEPETLTDPEPEGQEQPRNRWSTAFLMAGSAMAGAAALALWNRRTIASIRAQIQSQPEPRVGAAKSDEEIY